MFSTPPVAQYNSDTTPSSEVAEDSLPSGTLEYVPLRGIAAALTLTLLAAVIFGLVPFSVLFSGLLGTVMLTAWVTGTIAFACSLQTPRLEVAQAIAFRNLQRAAQSTSRARRAA
jgi:hypothetical protein